jgi:hypothetical protein
MAKDAADAQATVATKRVPKTSAKKALPQVLPAGCGGKTLKADKCHVCNSQRLPSQKGNACADPC